MRDADVDYYAVLGVHAGASAAEITGAYRRLIRRLHPDTRSQYGSGDSDAAADRQLVLVRTAFDLLSDPVRRAAYDRRRGRHTPVTVTRQRPPTPGGGEAPIRAGPVRYRPG